MARQYRSHSQALALLDAWTAHPRYRQWYFFIRVVLIVNRSLIPVIVALGLIAAGLLTWVLGQNVLYGLLMMAIGAAVTLILIWLRPNK